MLLIFNMLAPSEVSALKIRGLMRGGVARSRCTPRAEQDSHRSLCLRSRPLPTLVFHSYSMPTLVFHSSSMPSQSNRMLFLLATLMHFVFESQKRHHIPECNPIEQDTAVKSYLNHRHGKRFSIGRDDDQITHLITRAFFCDGVICHGGQSFGACVFFEFCHQRSRSEGRLCHNTHGSVMVNGARERLARGCQRV